MVKLTRAHALFVASLPALLLGGCDLFGGSPTQGGDGATSNAILEASVSDAMIPTDTVTSQPPLAPLQPGEVAASDDAEAVTEGEGEAVEGETAGEPAEPEAAE